jgi:hypothetical protein
MNGISLLGLFAIAEFFFTKTIVRDIALICSLDKKKKSAILEMQRIRYENATFPKLKRNLTPIYLHKHAT